MSEQAELESARLAAILEEADTPATVSANRENLRQLEAAADAIESKRADLKEAIRLKELSIDILESRLSDATETARTELAAEVKPEILALIQRTRKELVTALHSLKRLTDLHSECFLAGVFPHPTARMPQLCKQFDHKTAHYLDTIEAAWRK